MLKRELTAELNGEEITLAATFKASMDVADKVGDPLLIAREAALEAMLSNVGQVYHPKFMFDLRNVPTLIHIGMKAAGSGKKLEDVQEMVFGGGLIAAKEIASRYLALIVEPRSEELAKEARGPSTPGE